MKSEKNGDLVDMSEVLQFRATLQPITLPAPFNIDPIFYFKTYTTTTKIVVPFLYNTDLDIIQMLTFFIDL
jgi:hypothetical protein